MTEHKLFYYPYASFTNAQLPLLKVAALWFDKLLILDPFGASWDVLPLRVSPKTGAMPYAYGVGNEKAGCRSVGCQHE